MGMSAGPNGRNPLKILKKTLYLESEGAFFPETFLTKQHKYKSIVFEAASVFSFLDTEETKGKTLRESSNGVFSQLT